MPFTIKKLKMWKDPGYTEECVEVPPVGSWKLPAADWENVHTVEGVTQSYDLRPRKYATLTSIELPIAFSETWDMSYLYMEATDTAGSIRIFGWIRTVERIAASEEAVRIAWVPDYWRTFSGDLTFGRGTVTKTSDASYKRPLRLQPRLRIKDFELTMTNGQSLQQKYEVIVYSKNSGVNGERTDLKIAVSQGMVITSLNGAGIQTGVDSDKIIAVFICDYDITQIGTWQTVTLTTPGTYTYKTIDLIAYSQYTDKIGVSVGTSDFWIWNQNVSAYMSGLTSIETTDNEVIQICDFTGSPIGTLPYGMNVTRFRIGVAVSTTTAYYIMQMGNGSRYYDSTEGGVFTLPLPTYPNVENQMSSYIISGQRDFDIQSKRIAQQKALGDGITGSAGSAISGALTGALVGAAGGPIGAVGGAAIGLSTSLISATINDWTQTKANDALQELTDKLYSNQAANIMLAGDSLERACSMQHIRIIGLKSDDVSAAEISDYIANNGYDVEISVSDCSTFLSSGPVRIINMQVSGEVMPAAKTAIKDKIANGVYIVENNPTGVLP